MNKSLPSCWSTLKNFFFFLLIITNINVLLGQQIPYVITFFIKPFEKATKEVSTATIEKKFTVPGKTAKTIAQQLALKYPASGIYVSYMGYLAISDHSGQITFPNRQLQDKINILITQAIQPVPISLKQRNTIRGFIVDPKARSEFYELIRKPAQTGILSWYIEQKPVSTKILAPDTIIILSDPKHIIIPTGIYPTFKSGNLVLPDVYVTKDLNLTNEILRFFKFKYFFGQLDKTYAYQKLSYQQRISV